MARLLLWIVLGLAAWWMLRPRRRVQPPAGARVDRAAPPAAAVEAMVDCAACGLHFPASEAIRDGASLYCCAAHRDAGPRRGQ
jgi:uncharacterized protein